jgi:uroporphyrinogen-III synthase
VSENRVLVVRSGANPFLSLGESSAVEVVERSSHAIEKVEAPADRPEGQPDLVLFTSQVAVERAATDPRLGFLLAAAGKGARLAAVGSVTAEALARHGVPPRVTAGGSAEALLERLPRNLAGWRVVFPCGDDAAEELPAELRARGARVERLVVYRKIPRPHDPALDRQILEEPFAAFCTTSPSAVRWLFEGLSPEAAARLRQTDAVVLGPTTRRYLEELGVERIAITSTPSFAEALRLLEHLATGPRAA